MADAYGNIDSVTAPARSGVAITPNDSTDLATIPKAIYVGTAGNLVLDAVDSGTNLSFAVTAGQIFDALRPRKVKTTSTAGGLIALY